MKNLLKKSLILTMTLVMVFSITAAGAYAAGESSGSLVVTSYTVM